VELSFNDREARGGSREVMDGNSEGESLAGCRIHSRPGGTVGHIVSGRNEQHSQHYVKDAKHLQSIKEVVECQQQTEKKMGRKCKQKKM
jgi:hypothetical protein